MTCSFDRELLALFAAGDATETEQRQAELHLQECAECARIVSQYGALSEAVAGSLAGVSAARPIRRRRWGALVAAAAAAFVLFGTLQIPVVKAQVAKIYSFMTVHEMDQAEVTESLERSNAATWPPANVTSPEVFASIEEAEAAWGGRFPQPPNPLLGMRLDHSEVFRFDSGEKWVILVYTEVERGRHVSVRLSTSQMMSSVPEGSTSETVVRGQEAVVIRGSFSRFESEPFAWKPESGIRLFFPLGELYAEVFTWSGLTLEELVQVAESLQ